MLQVEKINYRHAHGSSWALKNISFALAKGQILLLCGHSGSGKSTLLSVLSGLIPHYFKGEFSGLALLDDESPSQMSLNAWGLRTGFMMQNPETQFVASTVEEEILLTLRCRNIKQDVAAEAAQKQIEKFKLADIAGQSVFDLSEGQKQKVVLAALCALKPKLLLLDEPSANLDQKSRSELAAILAKLKNDGISMVIADHRLSWLNGLVDQVLVLEDGQAVGQGSWKILENETFRTSYHLRPLQEKKFLTSAAQTNFIPAEAVKIQDLSFNYPGKPELFSHFNADLPLGKVTVLTGPSGCGKTTLAKILCGLEKLVSGRIDFTTSTETHHYGQVVLQNADHQLYMSTAYDEIEMSLRLNRAVNAKKTHDILAEFGLDALTARHPQSLSGGEKQRLVVAVGLTSICKLLILDEPTSGLDGYNLKLMSEQIRKIADQGLAVLIITHDSELAGLCADFHINLAVN